MGWKKPDNYFTFARLTEQFQPDNDDQNDSLNVKDIEEPAPNDADNLPSGTFFSTFCNIVKNVIGAGVLTLPYSIGIFGWTGLLFLVFILLLVNSSVFTIVHCMEFIAKRDDSPLPSSYAAITTAAFGHTKSGLITDCILFVYTLGNLTSYQILIPQLVMQLVVEFFPDPPSYITERLFWQVVASSVLMCICVFKTITALRFTSGFGVVVCIYLIVLSVTNASSSPASRLGEVPIVGHSAEIFQAFGVLVFCYSFHYNAPRFYLELKGRSQKKFMSIVASSYTLIFLIYLVFIFAMLSVYGTTVSSNAIRNFPISTAFGILRASFAIMIVCTYPVIQFQTRSSVTALLAHFTKQPRTKFEDEFAIRATISGVIIGVSLVIGYIAPDIGVVLAYNGAVVGALQLLVLPGVWTLMLHKLDHQWTLSKFGRLEWLAVTLISSGLVGGVLGVTGTTLKLTKG